MGKLMQTLWKRKVCMAILAVFWVTVLIMFRPFSTVGAADTRRYSYDEDAVGNAGELAGAGREACSQRFLAETDGLCGVNIQFATFGRNNTATYEITVRDVAEDTFILRRRINAQNITDNAYQLFRFPTRHGGAGREYEIGVTSLDAGGGNALTVYYAPVDQDAFALRVGDADVNGTLVFERLYRNNGLYAMKTGCFAGLVLLSFLALGLLGDSAEKNFLILAAGLGVLTVFFHPFFHYFDESTHFFKALNIAQGSFTAEWKDGVIGGDWPSSLEFYAYQTDLRALLSDRSGVLWRPVNAELAFMEMPYAATYLPIAYLPNALGVWIGSVTGLPLLLTVWLGRLTGYAAYVVISYTAIKQARYFKSLFAVLALSPYLICVAGSYHVDAVLVSACLLFVSLCLKYITDDEGLLRFVSAADKAELLLCAMAIASVKYCGYALVLGLFFFIPKRVFRKRERFLIGTAIAAVVAAVGIWQVLLALRFPYIENRNGYASVTAQLSMIRHNFGDFVYTLVSDLGNNGLRRLPESVMSATFHLSVLESVRYAAALFPLLLAAVTGQKYRSFGKGISVYMATAGVAMILVIAVSLYVAFNRVGAVVTSIYGMQERYVLPSYILLLILFSSKLPVSASLRYENLWSAFAAEIILLNMLCGCLRFAYGG